MGVKDKVLKSQEVALCFVRKWWRPITCVGIAGGSIVNLVIIPIVNLEVPDMASAAAYVTACAAAFGVRAFEKFKGID